jgi:transcriptional regulator
MHDEAVKRKIVGDLTASMEKMRDSTWQVSDAPTDYIEKMLSAIVGIELTIMRIQAKWKVSQNRDAADREGVARGLSGPGSTERDHRMRGVVLSGKGIGLN